MLNPLNIISKIFKSPNEKELDKLSKIVAKINEEEKRVSQFADTDFLEKTKEFKQKVKKGILLDEILRSFCAS